MMTTAEALALALEYQQRGALPEAESLCRQILAADPNDVEALQLLGILSAQLGHKALAVTHFSRAVSLKPDLAKAHYNLGVALRGQGKASDAVISFREAICHEPDFAEAHYNLGIALMELGQTEEAVGWYRRVVRLRPDFADAHSNLIQALRLQGKLEEALVPVEQVVRLKPDSAHALNDLGLAHVDVGQPEQALAAFERALSIEPNYGPAHFNRGMALLLLGRLQEGWPEYDWRLRCDDYPETLLPLPLWDGADLTGKTIVLVGEQGLGDTLQFIRYAPLVKARGATVVAACPSLLMPIVAGCPGMDHLVLNYPGAALVGTVQALLTSLPGIFGTTLETIPMDIPYLFADPVRLGFWRQRLASVTALKVGIVWQGSSAHPRDRWRSVPLAQFAPLARVKGVRLFSLQMDLGRDQLAALAPLTLPSPPGAGGRGEGEGGGRFEITDLGAELAVNPFAEMAAAMKNLDLVVTVDTAAAHLAGALGVPVWVALPFANDWRWLRQREDSPWYPTMRLFRQRQRGSWQEVFERIAEELSKNACNLPARSSIVGTNRP